MMIKLYHATPTGASAWRMFTLVLLSILVTLPFAELDGMEYGTPSTSKVNSCQITDVSILEAPCVIPLSGSFTASVRVDYDGFPGSDELQILQMGNTVSNQAVSGNGTGTTNQAEFTNITLTAVGGAASLTAQFLNNPSCSLTVTIDGDAEAPSIDCPSDINLELGANCEVIIPDLSTLVTVSDNCTASGDLSITQDIPAGALSAAHNDVIEVTATVTDEAGISSDCEVVYTAADNIAPELSCSSSTTVTLDPSGNATLTASSVASGTDNCGNGVPKVITFLDASDSSFDCSDLGSKSVVVIAEDEAGNQDQCTITVTVVDNTAPTPFCSAVTVQLDSDGNGSTTAAVVENGNSSDACGVASTTLAQTSFDCSDVGGNSVILTVEDNNGNTSSCNSTITVEDNVAPVAICQDVTVQLQASGEGTLMPADVDNGSNDACGLDELSLDQTTFDCSHVGTQQVTLTVTDVNGNSSDCDADVTVEDNVNPVANCKSTTVQLDASGQASITTSDIDDNSSDACGVAGFSLDDTDLDCADFGNDPTVTLTVTDVNGNSSSCTATVFVEDNIDPVAQCLNPTVELRPEDAKYDLLQSDIYDAVNSGDNCGIVSVTFPPAIYGCQDAGNTFSVDLTVTDAAGNTDICTATVTVQEGDDLPNNWAQADVGLIGPAGNRYNFAPCSADLPENGEFAIQGSGNNGIGGGDNIAYAYQNICGNGMIVVKVESVDINGYGGITVRENASDPYAKQLSIFTNLSNVLYLQRRMATGAPKQSELLYRPFPVWLKVERIGNTFIASYSTNGSFFQIVSVINIPMQNCVAFGMASFSSFNAPSTAIFSNVQLVGSGGSMMIEAPETANVPAVSQQSQQAFELFPNPASDRVNLSIGQHQSPVRVVLRNQLGQVLEQRVVEPGQSNMEWPVFDLESGMYIFELQTAERDMKSLRFIKQ